MTSRLTITNHSPSPGTSSRRSRATGAPTGSGRHENAPRSGEPNQQHRLAPHRPDWWTEATAGDTSSPTRCTGSPNIQLDRQPFLDRFDGTTVTGTRDLPEGTFFDPDYTANKVGVVVGPPALALGRHGDHDIRTRGDKFEVEAKPTTNKLVIRMYQDGRRIAWTPGRRFHRGVHVHRESNLARNLHRPGLELATDARCRLGFAGVTRGTPRMPTVNSFPASAARSSPTRPVTTNTESSWTARSRRGRSRRF